MPDALVSSSPCTCYSLRRLTRTVTRLYDLHLSAAGLRTTQYSLLRTVAHAPLPIAALADRLATERTTLTRNLRPLIDAGLIAIKPGADARQKIATITPAGREAIRRATAAWKGAQAELEATLGADTVRVLHGQLDTALRQLNPLLESRTHADES